MYVMWIGPAKIDTFSQSAFCLGFGRVRVMLKLKGDSSKVKGKTKKKGIL